MRWTHVVRVNRWIVVWMCDGVINIGGNVDMWWCCGEVDIHMDSTDDHLTTSTQTLGPRLTMRHDVPF